MLILDSEKSGILRQQYIQTFVNSASHYYIENIERKTRFSDGLCYTGYLWDCLINPKIITEDKADRRLLDKRHIFIMWDIHSRDRVFIPDSWKYPKARGFYTKKWEDAFKAELPDDIYLFDAIFRWSVVYTHETDLKKPTGLPVYGKKDDRPAAAHRKDKIKDLYPGEEPGDASLFLCGFGGSVQREIKKSTELSQGMLTAVKPLAIDFQSPVRG